MWKKIWAKTQLLIFIGCLPEFIYSDIQPVFFSRLPHIYDTIVLSWKSQWAICAGTTFRHKLDTEMDPNSNCFTFWEYIYIVGTLEKNLSKWQRTKKTGSS